MALLGHSGTCIRARRINEGIGDRRKARQVRARFEHRAVSGPGRAGTVALLLAISLLLIPTAWGAPGETWDGTLKVTEQRSATTTDAFGNVQSSFSRSHTTTFSLTSVPGTDDDPYLQPLSGWHTRLNESQTSGGRCPSYTTRVGEASGSDGTLQITVVSPTQLALEVVGFGSPGHFPVTERSGSCQSGETVSSTSGSHQTFKVQTEAAADAQELQGSFVQQFSDGTITYEWDLVRAPNPTPGDDNLTGTGGNDFVELAEGNDVYSGLGGDDKVYGGQGDDQIDGDTGNDRLIGGSGGDTVSGGGGADTINGDGPDSATRSQAYRGDYAAAAAGPDLLFGGGGGDHLTGGGGVDRFNGGPGRDTCVVDSRREKRRARSCETIRLRRSH